MKNIVFILLVCLTTFSLKAQNVGIGTTEPKARLHVADSSVLFTGGPVAYFENPEPPVSWAGSRMMWMAPKAAFRAGVVNGSQWNAENIGVASLGVGENVTASGQRSVALGSGSVASGNASLAAGYYSQSSGNSSLAFGHYANANGTYSIALGYSPVAEGFSSIALGLTATASGNQSIAIGTGTNSGGIRQTVLGSFNTVANGSGDTWMPTDPILMVGNGYSESERSTALTILKNGNTGIGILQPQAKLQVNGQLMIGNGTPQANLHVEGNQLIKRNSFTGGAHLTLEETQSGDGARLQFRNTTIGNNNWEVYGRPHASSANDALFNIYYSPAGDAMVLRGNGNVWFRGSVSQNSDARLKKDIKKINSPLEKIQQLNGYHYYWKDSTRDRQLQTGLLAQEIETLMPELVSTDDNGMKSVNYTGLIPYLIEAIKEQQTIIEQLRSNQTSSK